MFRDCCLFWGIKTTTIIIESEGKNKFKIRLISFIGKKMEFWVLCWNVF